MPPLEHGEPVRLAQHQGSVEQLRLIDAGRLVSTGRDAALSLTAVSGWGRHCIFVGDSGFTHIDYDAESSVIVAADTGGSVHLLPLT